MAGTLPDMIWLGFDEENKRAFSHMLCDGTWMVGVDITRAGTALVFFKKDEWGIGAKINFPCPSSRQRLVRWAITDSDGVEMQTGIGLDSTLDEMGEAIESARQKAIRRVAPAGAFPDHGAAA